MEDHLQVPGDVATSILVAVGLVLANALFVMAEYALVRVRPTRLAALSQAGSWTAGRALKLVERLDESISVCQVGITLCGLGLGYVAEPAFAGLMAALLGKLLSPVSHLVGPLSTTLAIGASLLLVTFLVVVLGELVPKRLTIAKTERIALATALPIHWFGIVAWPLVVLFNGTARLLSRGMNLGGTEDAGHSREEIRQLVVMSAKSGTMDLLEVGLLENLFRFARRRARDAMVPRARVVALDVTKPLDVLLARARSEGYSRYPVIEGDLDRLVGIVHVKDLFTLEGKAPTHADLRRIVRPPLIVPDGLPLERLLGRFQAERAHLAVVADEYGAVVGIVSLEDVLEELVGELRDEFDVEEQDQVRARPGGGWVLDPALPVDRAAELVPDAPEVPEGIHTLAGLLQSELGRLPDPGDRIPFGEEHELVASVVQGTRILRVELVPSATAGNP